MVNTSGRSINEKSRSIRRLSVSHFSGAHLPFMGLTTVVTIYRNSVGGFQLRNHSWCWLKLRLMTLKYYFSVLC